MKTKTLNSLFQPITINGLTLKNRIVMPAIGTRFANENGAVTHRLIDFHVERAKGGVGFQIVEQSFINEERPACMISLSSDQMIPRLNDLVEAIHEEGGKVAIQIGNLGFVFPGGKGPDEFTTSEIMKLIKEFVGAAIRAQDAGFDAIEIHAAHRYLIVQFLSSQTNHRIDKYGGDLEGRMTFLLEILQSTRERLGPDYPIIVRINGDGFDPEGLGLEEAKVIAKKLEVVGVDAIDISAGTWKSPERTVPPMCFPRGCHVYLAAAIKQEVRIPVITAGRINDPILANEIIQEGKTDLVAMGRALLADPLLPEKARQGNLEDICMCTGCNYCHGERLYRNKSIKCAVNASLGREREYALKKVEKSKKVFVIGGGVAGMEAAWTLKRRGHEVVLWEKETELGGQLRYAAIPPHKEELKNILQWLSYQVKKLGVKIHLGCEVTIELLNRTKPDEVIFATGSTPIILNVPGINGQQVFTARDVLGSNKIELGTHVVIIGGGRVGCETAEYLAEKGGKVTIIEILHEIALDMEPRNRRLLLERLKLLGVDSCCNSKVVKIQDNNITFYDEESQEKHLIVDSIILATGSQSNNKLQQRMLNYEKVVYSIGDCIKPGDIADAIHGGAHIGRLI